MSLLHVCMKGEISQRGSQQVESMSFPSLQPSIIEVLLLYRSHFSTTNLIEYSVLWFADALCLQFTHGNSEKWVNGFEGIKLRMQYYCWFSLFFFFFWVFLGSINEELKIESRFIIFWEEHRCSWVNYLKVPNSIDGNRKLKKWGRETKAFIGTGGIRQEIIKIFRRLMSYDPGIIGE